MRASGEKLIRKVPIIDKNFAKRLGIACENHPRCPADRGRQAWIRDHLHKELGIDLSSEAISKWFAGETRPRFKVMSKLAQLLGVDEAWLSLGTSGRPTPTDTLRQNALALGAVNLVAGHFQLAGGHIAFPSEKDDVHDISVILAGKQRFVNVVYHEGGFPAKIDVPLGAKEVIVVLSGSQPTSHNYLKVSADNLEHHMRTHRKRAEMTLAVEKSGKGYTLAGEPLALISDFKKF